MTGLIYLSRRRRVRPPRANPRRHSRERGRLFSRLGARARDGIHSVTQLPRRALWLEEGNATWVEPIARAQAGQIGDGVDRSVGAAMSAYCARALGLRLTMTPVSVSMDVPPYGLSGMVYGAALNVRPNWGNRTRRPWANQETTSFSVHRKMANEWIWR